MGADTDSWCRHERAGPTGGGVASALPGYIEEGTQRSKAMDAEDRTTPLPEAQPPCPRCHSSNTKFCYFNNYKVKQPRYFCKDCERHWTAGGSLRRVRVGAGRRKSKSRMVMTAGQGKHSGILGLAPVPSLKQVKQGMGPTMPTHQARLIVTSDMYAGMASRMMDTRICGPPVDGIDVMAVPTKTADMHASSELESRASFVNSSTNDVALDAAAVAKTRTNMAAGEVYLPDAGPIRQETPGIGATGASFSLLSVTEQYLLEDGTVPPESRSRLTASHLSDERCRSIWARFRAHESAANKLLEANGKPGLHYGDVPGKIRPFQPSPQQSLPPGIAMQRWPAPTHQPNPHGSATLVHHGYAGALMPMASPPPYNPANVLSGQQQWGPTPPLPPMYCPTASELPWVGPMPMLQQQMEQQQEQQQQQMIKQQQQMVARAGGSTAPPTGTAIHSFPTVHQQFPDASQQYMPTQNAKCDEMHL